MIKMMAIMINIMIIMKMMVKMIVIGVTEKDEGRDRYDSERVSCKRALL